MKFARYYLVSYYYEGSIWQGCHLGLRSASLFARSETCLLARAFLVKPKAGRLLLVAKIAPVMAKMPQKPKTIAQIRGGLVVVSITPVAAAGIIGLLYIKISFLLPVFFGSAGNVGECK